MTRLAVVALLACGLAPAQDFSKVSITKVGGNYRFTEGPLWSAGGYLLFSDIPASKIYRFNPGKGIVVFREESNHANGNAFDSRGRLYTCEAATRRVVRTDKNGKVEVLAEKFEGKRLNEPNDIVVRKDGHVWFTDPAYGSGEKTRELDFYGVFHITPKGDIEAIARLKTRPNGIALAPSGKILYVDNSDERNVRAYDIDRNGKASNERVLIPDVGGGPDGMKVDERGNLYVAAQSIYVFSPEGKQLAKIEIPEPASNCAFGDEDGQSLYVTARTSVYRVRLSQ
ncbi:MAG: SMP-30/gluconolactonase/LRE family protein [Acidobacteriota bacterium]